MLAVNNRLEIKFLLCCAQSRIDSKTAEKVNTFIEKKIDWVYLLELASYHKLIPLLYNSLNRICPQAVPHNILSQLQRLSQANALRNLFLSQELLNILNLFTANNISAIPFKGVTLAALAYGNVAFRQCGDLDLLVREQDFLKAKKLLFSQGYRMVNTEEQEICNLQAQLLQADGNVSIDLHYGIPPKSLQININSFWKHLESLSLGNITVPSLATIDLFSVLCINGFKESWYFLNKISDLAELLRSHPDFDWEKFMESISTLKIERLVFAGLFLARDIFEIELPQKIVQSMPTDIVFKWYVKFVRQKLLSGINRKPSIYMFFLNQMIREKPSDKFPYFISLSGMILHILITPSVTDKLNFPLPSNLNLLYYPLRPILLISRILENFLKLEKSDNLIPK